MLYSVLLLSKYFKHAVVHLIVFLILSAAASSAYANEINSALNVFPKVCKHGLTKQPNGPFAAIVFCEDALGTYLAVLCYAAGQCERREYSDKRVDFEGWELADRVWQDKDWASDVDSFLWSTDSKYLFVATSEIYGSGGLFQLDLERRKAKQLLPNDRTVSRNGSPGPGYSIVSLSKDGRYLAYRLQESEEKTKPLILELSQTKDKESE